MAMLGSHWEIIDLVSKYNFGPLLLASVYPNSPELQFLILVRDTNTTHYIECSEYAHLKLSDFESDVVRSRLF